MDSDRSIGAGIIIVCIVAAIAFFGPLVVDFPWGFALAVRAVVSIGFLVLLGIGGWIGWTMASTPSPEPVEDLDFEDEELEEVELEEEETEEEKDE